MVRPPQGSQMGAEIRTPPPVRWEGLQSPERSCVSGKGKGNEERPMLRPSSLAFRDIHL